MPYIKQDERELLTQGMPADTAGHLNYIFTQEIVSYIKEKGLSYQTINDIIGALEAAKQEFYRRVAGPYEDGKIKLNGDVYGQEE